MPSRFARGFSSPFSSVGFVLSSPRLWLYLMLPILLNLALTVGVALAGYRWVFEPLMAKVGHGESFVAHVGRIAAGIGLTVMLVIAGAFVFSVLASILGAPFYDRMGERMEKTLFQDRPDLLAPSMGALESARLSILETLRRWGIAVPVVVIGFLLGFVPVAGPFLAFVIGGGGALAFLALDAWSYPLERRRQPLQAKLRYMRVHFSTALGLGVGLWVMYLIPCAWFVIPPLAAAAGTRLFCEIEKETPPA